MNLTSSARRIILTLGCGLIILGHITGIKAQEQSDEMHWFRGNTHTHTTNSDGNSSPEDVAKWYSDHGYDFLFITDHNLLTEVEPLNKLFGSDGKFLLIPGEEVTSTAHINALNPRGVIKELKEPTLGETIQKNVDAIRAAGGVAQINHPNYNWRLTAKDIIPVKGAALLEIMNMHGFVNSNGAGPGFPSVEEMWDMVLSSGTVIWGAASDDTHQLREIYGRGSVFNTLPGRGWIMVRAKQLTVGDIMSAIERGDFYSSTGVVIENYEHSGKTITVALKADPSKNRKYRVQFIGKKGRILQDTVGETATYRIKGNEGYVRARITESNGKMAWTQPVFLSKLKKEQVSK